MDASVANLTAHRLTGLRVLIHFDHTTATKNNTFVAAAKVRVAPSWASVNEFNKCLRLKSSVLA